MKDLEWCVMDEMDFYIKRCVKNWAAKRQPPTRGRARLIKAASASLVQNDRQVVRFINYLKLWITVSQDIYSENDLYRGPITQSRAWSFHFAANCR